MSNIREYHPIVMKSLKRSTKRNPKRTTLLINLSVEQAEEIRAAAKKQDRTISSYILRAVMRRIDIERQVENKEDFFTKYLEKTGGFV